MTPTQKPTRREHREAAIQILYSQSFTETDLGRVASGVAMNRTLEAFQGALTGLRETSRAAQQAIGTIESLNATMVELVKPPEMRKKVKLDDSSPISLRTHLARSRASAVKELEVALAALKNADQIYTENGLCIRLIATFDKHRESIETALARALEGWSLRRLTAEDGAILRLGITELMYMEDIPQVTTINEYIELSKEFSDADAPRLVNGVLDRVRKEHPREDPRQGKR
ncbi:transcription antitermination factor NusB [bacterium]|nr:transcription antitermination factor NusB [bacterium]